MVDSRDPNNSEMSMGYGPGVQDNKPSSAAIINSQYAMQEPMTPTSAAIYLPQNDGLIKIEVHAPVLIKQQIQDYHAYPITGVDSLGEIECQRRFNLFYEFRQALIKRFCGLYVPPLPPKQIQGKGAELTLIDRQYFLDIFMKECCSYKYIAQSAELQTFLRPNEDLKAALQRYQNRQSTADRIALMRATCNVSESFEDDEVGRMMAEVQGYQNEQVLLIQNLKDFKFCLKDIVPLKQSEREYYKNFASFLVKYEESKEVSNGTGEYAHVKLVSGQGGDYLKSKMEDMAFKYKNPTLPIYHWVKGELYALEALKECTTELTRTDELKRGAQDKILSLNEEIDKLNEGKFTFGSIFKNDAEKKQSAVEKAQLKAQLEQDVLNYDVIKKILSLYMYQSLLPDFKKKGVQRYILAMKEMCQCEMGNASSLNDCWNHFFTLIESFKIK